jgi:hypothetical protein
MRGFRARRFGAVAGVVALAAMALTVTTAAPASADPSQPGAFTDGEIAAGRALLSHVPGEFRLTCTIEALDKVPEPEGIIADVECSPKGTSISSIEYEQFDGQANVDTEYANLLSEAEGKSPSGCVGDEPYTINGQDAGRDACFTVSLGTYLDYTYTPLSIVASIFQAEDTPGAPDIDALNDFANNSAGPNATAEEIPSLLSDADAQAAVTALIGDLKPAVTKHCSAENPESNPWKSVSLSCEKPSKGVFTASYDQYRDDDSYAGAFDPDALAKLSVKKNKSCPASGSWSVDGKTQGKYACWIDESKTTHLVWGVDSQRIVASAFAQDGDGMTSAQFLNWWDTKGSIKP